MKSFGKFVRGKAFAGMFVAFAACSVFYVSDRMGKLGESVFSYDMQWSVFGILSLLLGYMFIYLKTKKERKRTRKLYEICSVVVCFLLYLVLFLWGCDVWKTLFSVEQDAFYGIAVLGAVLVTIYGFLHAKKIYLKEYRIEIPALRKKKKVALISDVHVGTFVNAKQLDRIVTTINEIGVDAVIIAGDLFDIDAFPYCDHAKIARILRKLEPNGKIFAVLGNHDPSSDSVAMKEFYKDAGIELLVDQVKETEDFVLIGRDDITTNPNRNSLHDLIQMINPIKPHIVIDHNPLGIPEAIQELCDVILCGHTHKGQFFPANIFTKFAYGDVGFYGYHQEGKTQSVVSSGVGYFQMPMRIGSNSEIVVLQCEGKTMYN